MCVQELQMNEKEKRKGQGEREKVRASKMNCSKLFTVRAS